MIDQISMAFLVLLQRLTLPSVLFYSCAMSLIGADGRIKTISDYQHRQWVLTAGSVVVREFAG